jgi:hypothetical protein
MRGGFGAVWAQLEGPEQRQGKAEETVQSGVAGDGESRGWIAANLLASKAVGRVRGVGLLRWPGGFSVGQLGENLTLV